MGLECGRDVRDVFDCDDVLSPLRAVQAIVTHLEKFPTVRARAACGRAHLVANYTYQGVRNILHRASVASTVRALPPGARPGDTWRSAAFVLLRLNPIECEALAQLFEGPATDETRILVLDLLAGAGTFEAQVIMRRLLALAVARKRSGTFAAFVQRLGIIECPDGPTLRFLMSVYAESRGEPGAVRAACAYALGAAAGQALAGGDTEAAVRASDVLRREPLASS